MNMTCTKMAKEKNGKGYYDKNLRAIGVTCPSALVGTSLLVMIGEL